MAGIAVVMCSYHLVNRTYATHSTIGAVTGLDMTVSGDITFYVGTSYFRANLTAYRQNGTIPEARMNDMAIHTIAKSPND